MWRTHFIKQGGVYSPGVYFFSKETIPILYKWDVRTILFKIIEVLVKNNGQIINQCVLMLKNCWCIINLELITKL